MPSSVPYRNFDKPKISLLKPSGLWKSSKSRSRQIKAFVLKNSWENEDNSWEQLKDRCQLSCDRSVYWQKQRHCHWLLTPVKGQAFCRKQRSHKRQKKTPIENKEELWGHQGLERSMVRSGHQDSQQHRQTVKRKWQRRLTSLPYPLPPDSL